MREPRRPEPDLGDAQPVAEFHQHVLVGNLEAFKHKLTMPAVLLRPHDRNAPHDLKAGLMTMKQKSREFASRIVGGARDQNEMVGNAGAGDEPLVAADHPAVALFLCTGTDHAGIGAAAGCRLGHRKGGAYVALDDRAQPLFLLSRRADKREEIHVAVVGRRTIERDRAEDRAVRLLIHRGPADDRQTHATVLLRRLRRPQALRFRLLANSREQIEADVFVVVVVRPIGLERQHMLVPQRRVCACGYPRSRRTARNPWGGPSTLRHKTHTSIVPVPPVREEISPWRISRRCPPPSAVR